VELPVQIVCAVGVAVTIGVWFTVTVIVVHPLAFVAITVYVVVEKGLTLTAVPVSEPGCHV